MQSGEGPTNRKLRQKVSARGERKTGIMQESLMFILKALSLFGTDREVAAKCDNGFGDLSGILCPDRIRVRITSIIDWNKN